MSKIKFLNPVETYMEIKVMYNRYINRSVMIHFDEKCYSLKNIFFKRISGFHFNMEDR